MKRLFPLALGLSLCAAAIWLSGCSRSSQTAGAAERTQPQKISVNTGQAAARTVPASFQLTGTFAAEESSDIAPLAAGRVIATPVDVGDFVKQGQVICELDHRDAQLHLDQAKAQLEQATSALRQSQARIGMRNGTDFEPANMPEVVAARANFTSAEAQAKLAAADATRYQNLVASGDVSRSAFDKARTAQETAEAQSHAARQQYEAALNGARQGWGGVQMSQAGVEAAKAQLAQAQKALDDTTIRAPFDGYITARPIAAGEYVALTNKIATLVKIGTLKLELQTPEQKAAQVRVGMQVNARVSAYPDREFSGKVIAVNPSVDPASRIFTLRARFDNPGNVVRPGMFSTARVMLPGGGKRHLRSARGGSAGQDHGILPGVRG